MIISVRDILVISSATHIHVMCMIDYVGYRHMIA